MPQTPYGPLLKGDKDSKLFRPLVRTKPDLTLLSAFVLAFWIAYRVTALNESLQLTGIRHRNRR
jgi:hypothetical protein